jgi:hypothetical protein
MNLDNRHRDKNGEIERKHGNTKIKNLVGDYPVLAKYRPNTRLGALERRLNTYSLDGVIKEARRQNRNGR